MHIWNFSKYSSFEKTSEISLTNLVDWYQNWQQLAMKQIAF